jgi:uncharacterized protein
MRQSFVHTSENNNFYLYDDQHRFSALIHPELGKVHENSSDIDPYYLKKYMYLKEHGFFGKPKLANFEIILDESMVKDSIIQTKQIVFEVTRSCNLKCSYCVQGELYESSDKKNNKNINTHYAINLLKYILDLKQKNKINTLTISFYGGEPLLNVNFIEQIVKVAHNLGTEKEIDIIYAMTTNATLIHKHIHFLVKNKFRLLISLDGNEYNQSYRFFRKNKKNSFQKVTENLDMIQRDYPEYFDTHVSFNAVLHNRNSAKDIYEFIYNRYHKIPAISELTLENIKLDEKYLHDKMFHDKKKSIEKYQKEESCLIPHEELPLYHQLIDFLKYYSVNFYISNLMHLMHGEKKYFPTNTCLPFSKKMFLTNCHTLLPCEKINYKYSMGKVNQNVKIDISKITQQFNFYYEHLQKVCQYCYVYRFCGLCMFRIKNLNKLDTEKFVCDNFHNQKDFQIKLHRIFSFLEKYPNDFFEILENVVITT